MMRSKLITVALFSMINKIFAKDKARNTPLKGGIGRINLTDFPLEGGQGGVKDVVGYYSVVKKAIPSWAISLICSLTIVILLAVNSHAQVPRVDIDQSTIQFAKITDKRLIRLFLDDFMIPDDGITYLAIYDLNGDGFGEGDLAQTYPSGKVYLTTPTPKVQKLMNDWSFGGNVKFTAHANDNPDRYENAPDTVRAMGGIFASLLRGIRRNYQGKPIKIYLEQMDDVTSVQIWGYDPSLMRYAPLPINKVPEEVPVMKLIYLEKTVVDSVFTGK